MIDLDQAAGQPWNEVPGHCGWRHRGTEDFFALGDADEVERNRWQRYCAAAGHQDLVGGVVDVVEAVPRAECGLTCHMRGDRSRARIGGAIAFEETARRAFDSADEGDEFKRGTGEGTPMALETLNALRLDGTGLGWRVGVGAPCVLRVGKCRRHHDCTCDCAIAQAALRMVRLLRFRMNCRPSIARCGPPKSRACLGFPVPSAMLRLSHCQSMHSANLPPALVCGKRHSKRRVSSWKFGCYPSN
jgi:hypothetical protein